MNKLIVSLLQDKIDEYSNYVKEEYERHNYYCWDKNIRQNLITLLKIRSEYKRVLKEYKKRCRQIELQKYEKQVQYWKKNPIKFVEEMYRCKLFPYQKFMLKMVWNKRIKL